MLFVHKNNSLVINQRQKFFEISRIVRGNKHPTRNKLNWQSLSVLTFPTTNRQRNAKNRGILLDRSTNLPVVPIRCNGIGGRKVNNLKSFVEVVSSSAKHYAGLSGSRSVRQIKRLVLRVLNCSDSRCYILSLFFGQVGKNLLSQGSKNLFVERFA